MEPTQTPKPKRVRLSRKQVAFLKSVFMDDMPVNEALETHNIRKRTLHRWLTKPVFIRELDMCLRQLDLEARMEVARSATEAVGLLARLTGLSLNHEFVRKACNDLLNLNREYAAPRRGAKRDQKGAVPDKLGALLEQFGVVLDNNGAVSDTFGVSNPTQSTPQNPHYNPKNKENADSQRHSQPLRNMQTATLPLQKGKWPKGTNR